MPPRQTKRKATPAVASTPPVSPDVVTADAQPPPPAPAPPTDAEALITEMEAFALAATVPGTSVVVSPLAGMARLAAQAFRMSGLVDEQEAQRQLQYQTLTMFHSRAVGVFKAYYEAYGKATSAEVVLKHLDAVSASARKEGLMLEAEAAISAIRRRFSKCLQDAKDELTSAVVGRQQIESEQFQNIHNAQRAIQTIDEMKKKMIQSSLSVCRSIKESVFPSASASASASDLAATATTESTQVALARILEDNRRLKENAVRDAKIIEYQRCQAEVTTDELVRLRQSFASATDMNNRWSAAWAERAGELKTHQTDHADTLTRNLALEAEIHDWEEYAKATGITWRPVKRACLRPARVSAQSDLVALSQIDPRTSCDEMELIKRAVSAVTVSSPSSAFSELDILSPASTSSSPYSP